MKRSSNRFIGSYFGDKDQYFADKFDILVIKGNILVW